MIYEGSRYLSTKPYRSEKGAVVLTRRRKRKFNKEHCTTYTVVMGDTLDYLAYKFYESPVYWWAILDANPNYETEMDIKSGDSILIPNFEEVVVIKNE